MALSDESLVAGMASGDAEAAAAFVRRFQARVFGLALSVVGDTGLAEEVAQEAFVRVWRHAATYDPRRGRVATWLLTITRNLAVDAIRLRHKHRADPEPLLRALQPAATEDPFETDPYGSDQLRAGLQALPLEQSRPIVMSVFYGLTAKEIADREGIPLGTVKTRIRRGLAKLRHELGVSDD
ncbi:sigma-70 family RNA polymerase sigma factor [Acrocarpospora macrocephala]|uniref:RNA polymerase sigma factor n=2 Tax=Streptosporangiaceae TaxID=2004 RepID=A0A5M3WT96_9ACTN|nr:RNA polymerase sigma factor [Acrocarpospora macrocephala]